MKENRTIIISGLSGAGKGTLVRSFLSRNPACRLARSYTDRPMRHPEEPYYFINTAAFSRMIADGEFLEYSRYAGHHYGTSKEELRRIRKRNGIPLLEIDCEGFVQIKEKPEITREGIISLFVTAPDARELVRRLETRGTETAATIRARLKASLAQLDAVHLYDAVLVNDEIDRITARMEQIIFSGKDGDDFDADAFRNDLALLLKELEAGNET